MSATVDRAALIAWVKASCQAQGVPEKVSDLGALREVAVLLGVAGAPRAHGAAAPSTRRPRLPLQAPLRYNPLGV